MNGVLGEIALGDVDLAAAANAAPAADRIEIDAERARGFEQAHAFGELAALAGGCEDDAMVKISGQSSVDVAASDAESGHPEEAAMSCPENPRQPGPPLSRG